MWCAGLEQINQDEEQQLTDKDVVDFVNYAGDDSLEDDNKRTRESW